MRDQQQDNNHRDADRHDLNQDSGFDVRPKGDPSESTNAFDMAGYTDDALRSRAQGGAHEPPLFEQYERRSLKTIIAQQRAYRDSQAAQAAKVILEGVDPPTFNPGGEQTEAFLENGAYPNQMRFASIRVQRVSPMGRLVTPGAQFIYALLIIALLSGLIGLAASTDSPHLTLIAGIATPMLLPICIWKWIRWLDSDPYYYRLLTSLGEDARNLLAYRLLWKRSQP